MLQPKKDKKVGKTIRIGKINKNQRRETPQDRYPRSGSLKITSKSLITPINGNAFTGAMAKTGGDYDKAKALLGDSPAAYGTGSPFQLRKSKTFSPVDGNVVDKNKYTERRKDSIQKQKKRSESVV